MSETSGAADGQPSHDPLPTDAFGAPRQAAAKPPLSIADWLAAAPKADAPPLIPPIAAREAAPEIESRALLHEESDVPDHAAANPFDPAAAEHDAEMEMIALTPAAEEPAAEPRDALFDSETETMAEVPFGEGLPPLVLDDAMDPVADVIPQADGGAPLEDFFVTEATTEPIAPAPLASFAEAAGATEQEAMPAALTQAAGPGAIALAEESDTPATAEALQTDEANAGDAENSFTDLDLAAADDVLPETGPQPDAITLSEDDLTSTPHAEVVPAGPRSAGRIPATPVPVLPAAHGSSSSEVFAHAHEDVAARTGLLSHGIFAKTAGTAGFLACAAGLAILIASCGGMKQLAGQPIMSLGGYWVMWTGMGGFGVALLGGFIEHRRLREETQVLAALFTNVLAGVGGLLLWAVADHWDVMAALLK